LHPTVTAPTDLRNPRPSDREIVSWLRRILSQAFPQVSPEIDLHGLRVPEALAAVEQALQQAESRGASRLRIVCGKGLGSAGGRGVLREAVAGWLEHHGYRGRYRRDVSADGRDGALWVDVAPGTDDGAGQSP